MILINKPWGKEEIIEKNKHYLLKKITMFKNHRCSLQYHNKKLETLFILSGELKVFLQNTKIKKYYKLKKKDTLTIMPKSIHRMKAIKKCVYLECSTSHMTDVVRISDDYQRK